MADARAAGAAAARAAGAAAARVAGAGKAAAKATLRSAASRTAAAAELGGALPDRLHGVPDSLRTWWDRVDPKDLETSTYRTGRNEVLARIGLRLRADHRAGATVKAKRVVDLGCGSGLLAKEVGRRDIIGIDIAPAMIKAAQEVMDMVLPESFLEFYPSDRFDIAVLCNVLEPYPEEIRLLVLRHTFDFLNPGGQVIVVIHVQSLGGSRPSSADCGSDLVFPTASGPPVRPDDIEDGLLLAGFDIANAELVETKTLNVSSVLPGDEPKPERRTYAIIIGRKPIDPGLALATSNLA